MKKSTLRSVAIIVFLLVTAYYLAPLFFTDLPSFCTQKKLKLGLDLKGGMQINLSVDTSLLPQADQEEAVKSAVEVIRNRIDQFGVAEPAIQRIGANRIVVQLPGLRDFKRAQDLIGKTALLEFKLVSTPEETKRVVEQLDVFLTQNSTHYPYLKAYDDGASKPGNANSMVLNGKNKADSTKADSLSSANTGKIFSNLVAGGEGSLSVSAEGYPLLKKLLADTAFVNAVPAGFQICLGKEDKLKSKADIPVYVLYSNAETTGKYLTDANVKIGSQSDLKNANSPYISFKFNREGARKFEAVTAQNIKRNLAIVLDDVVYVAPTIQDRIRGGEGQITGQFTLDECQDLVIVLKAGNLPAPVKTDEIRAVGPTLGSDSIHSGAKAGIIGFVAIVLFMILYYGLSGFIADIALILNILFIFAALTFFRATLTLPGIAGIILTIGMAVDANVLIFERVREELRAGKTVRNAIDAGWARAMVTIVDANLTTLITAAVLYQFGTGSIRGFAVTLSIGILSSMFTAIVLVKAIYDNWILNKNRTKLSI